MFVDQSISGDLIILAGLHFDQLPTNPHLASDDPHSLQLESLHIFGSNRHIMAILRRGRGNGCSNAGSEQKLASALPQACSCTSRLLTAVAVPGKGMDLAKNWVPFE